MEKISIPVITILSYIIGEFFKLIVLRKKKRYKYIPINRRNSRRNDRIKYGVYQSRADTYEKPYTATAIGIVSGLASTGTKMS